ncbi:hypothetical protein EIK77_000229 [Talaromyces pinophilus]|nr:hypothetical protein EIK77_000229 [Talaromyces pinophilus]
MDCLITHTIDPDGEVIIMLCNANAPFAEFYDDQDAITEMLAQEATVEEKDHVQSRVETADDATEHDWEGFDTSSVRKSKKKKKLKKEKKKPRSFSPVETVVRPAEEPEPEPAEPEPAEPESVNESVVELEAWPVQELESEPEPVDESTQDTDKYQSEHNVYIQVSAKHLMLASPVFKSMLTGSWKESVTSSKLQNGSIEISTDSWDIDAFLILLRIIHCQFNQVPRKLSLEMLAKVAVIADYYKCKEVVQFFSDTWIVVLEGAYVEEYSRDLILRLWIAWFFQLSSQFRTVTSIAMSHSGGLISNLGLPIPNRVIALMKSVPYAELQPTQESFTALLIGQREAEVDT